MLGRLESRTNLADTLHLISVKGLIFPIVLGYVKIGKEIMEF